MKAKRRAGGQTKRRRQAPPTGDSAAPREDLDVLAEYVDRGARVFEAGFLDVVGAVREGLELLEQELVEALDGRARRRRPRAGKTARTKRR